MKFSNRAQNKNLLTDAFNPESCAASAAETALVRAANKESFNRRTFMVGSASAAVLASMPHRSIWAAEDQGVTVNLAKVATASSLYVSGDTKLSALNDGITPNASNDDRSGSFGTWPKLDTQWVQYEWSEPVTTNKVDVYWWIDGAGVGAPASYRILHWNGSDFVPVANPQGLGIAANTFNSTTFDAVQTSKLRIELTSDGKLSPGILEWKVFSSGPVPLFPPTVNAGIDRVVVFTGRTYLSGKADWLTAAENNRVRWTKASGPGQVSFADPSARETTATFSAPGEYVLRLTAIGDREDSSSTLIVQAEPAPPEKRLDVVYTTRYAIDNPLWNERAKTLIVTWIPHCAAQCERTDLTQGRGGLDNFIEAGKALRGESHGRHKGYVFSNAWVHQTVESMCIALMVDAQNDQEMLAAQQKMKATLERWIPIILAAQEPDGYLQTAYTLADRRQWPERWSADHRGNHEGYVSGYFIESAINHYTLTRLPMKRFTCNASGPLV